MKKILLLSISVIICSPNLTYAQSNLLNRSYSPDSTGGFSNSFFGRGAGISNTNGNDNAFFGYSAGSGNTTGSYNAIFGSGAGGGNTNYNSSFGALAGGGGYYNAFFGAGAGYYNTTGGNNAFLGTEAGENNTTGARNVYVGIRAGQYNVTGTDNVFIGMYAGGSNTGGDANVFLGYQAGYSELGSNKLYIENDSTAIPLIYGDFETNQVGIDTKSIPSGYSFAVAGKIAVEEVLIDVQTNWPDYVFNTDYELPTIKEVETFIARNGHLKDIPSAEEVQEHGILQGEMDAKLLKKIEELTLYIIELNNTNTKLKEANAVLNERIQKLEETVNSLKKN